LWTEDTRRMNRELRRMGEPWYVWRYSKIQEMGSSGMMSITRQSYLSDTPWFAKRDDWCKK